MSKRWESEWQLVKSVTGLQSDLGLLCLHMSDIFIKAKPLLANVWITDAALHKNASLHQK